MTPPSGHASLILENACIRTQDPARPFASAMAVGQGRILAVGEPQDMAPFAGSDTERLDLQGRLCLPGFMDAHFHYFQWAMGQAQLQLDQARDFGHCMQLVTQAAEAAGPGEWILGQGFNETDWPEPRLPDRDALDVAAPQHPVLLWRCDLHLAVANSTALKLAGVDESVVSPADGVVDRDPAGRLTGVLREGAANLVKGAIPLPDAQTLSEIFHSAQNAAHRLGLTALHDVRLTDVKRESALTTAAWQMLRGQDRLKLRVWTGIPGECLQLARDLGLRSGLGDEMLRIGHVKYFFDGGMGARTAWMLEPYADTGECGLQAWHTETLYEQMLLAHESGLALMIHAIGDRASRELVTLYERLEQEAGNHPCRPAIRHRMEHAQVIRPEDVARLARLDVPVSMMPTNMVLDINMISRCAPGAAPYAYPFRPMLDAGINVLFSSDCPVCDPSPLAAIQGAVTRQRPDGTPAEGWHKELAVSVAEAVTAYTSAPARAYGLQKISGSLSPGKQADFIVLDRDIHEIPPLEIADCTVLLTAVAGEVVHSQL